MPGHDAHPLSLTIIKLDPRLIRPLLIISAVLYLVAGWFFASWCFANTISLHADTKEIADLAVALAPGDPQTHYAAGVVYEKTFDADDLNRSLAEYETSARLSPNNYLSWLALGKARERNGDTTGAEQALQRALDLAPNYADVHWAYGNLLVRDNRVADGFAQMAVAAGSKSEYAGPAVVTAMTLLDGDVGRVQEALGDTSAVTAAISAFALGEKRYDEAVSAWDRISAEEKQGQFKSAGDTLVGRLAEAKQFRLAAHVARDLRGGEAPPTEGIFNGGFETPVKLRDAPLFDWQVGPGADPQIGVNEEQRHGGAYSLFMRFNTMQAADFRQLSQTVAVEPGTRYSLDGFYRAELKGSVGWEIVSAGDGQVLARGVLAGSTTDWVAFGVSFTVPPGSDGIIIRMVRDGCASAVCPISGKAWFDDISLRRQ